MNSQVEEALADECVTDLLREWNEGNDEAFARVIPLIYSELRDRARLLLRHERPNQTMQTAALVNEAYLRLVNCNRLRWKDRRHFLAVAARIMRRVLVEEARRRKSLKRGGIAITVLFDEPTVVSPERDEEWIALDDALWGLEKLFKFRCRVVELRYFAGLTIEETAKVLNVSADTVKREWRLAKMWLWREMRSNEAGHGSTNR